MAQRVTVRERIDPAITASLFANYRSSADAVMELVDNAIDSRIKGGQLEVLLQVHPSYFVIETRGGEGMGPAELERNYLRWGGSPKTRPQAARPVRSGRQSGDRSPWKKLHRRSQPTRRWGRVALRGPRLSQPFQAQDLRAESGDQARAGGAGLCAHSHRRRRQASRSSPPERATR